MGLNIEDYRNAPEGIGPQAAQWADKPHRLIYDLCSEVKRLRAEQEALLSLYIAPCRSGGVPLVEADLGFGRDILICADEAEAIKQIRRAAGLDTDGG